VVEQGDFAEEFARLQVVEAGFPAFHLDAHPQFSFDEQIHGVGGITLPGERGSRRNLLHLDHLKKLFELRVVQAREHLDVAQRARGGRFAGPGGVHRRGSGRVPAVKEHPQFRDPVGFFPTAAVFHEDPRIREDSLVLDPGNQRGQFNRPVNGMVHAPDEITDA